MLVLLRETKGGFHLSGLIMNFADNYARLFVVISFLGLEAAITFFSKAEIVGGIVPNLIAFGLFLVAISYFLFTGPLFGKGKKNG